MVYTIHGRCVLLPHSVWHFILQGHYMHRKADIMCVHLFYKMNPKYKDISKESICNKISNIWMKVSGLNVCQKVIYNVCSENCATSLGQQSMNGALRYTVNVYLTLDIIIILKCRNELKHHSQKC